MDSLKRTILQMEEKMKMLQETHNEEKQELNDTIAQMKTDIHSDDTEGDGLEDRLGRLEDMFKTVLLGGSIKTMGQNSGTGERTTESRHVSGESTEGEQGDDDSRGKEQNLSLTFGDIDTSPSSLERFISHYELVDEINRERNIRAWAKPSYRALMVRMAMRGPVADYLDQESKLLSPWVKDDQEIIARLRARYIKNSAVELHIISFETALQGDGEPLAEYMVRLQKLAHNAYTEYPEWIKQNRVVWQFLNGAKDRDVREAIIKEGWMINNKEAKNYEKVLKMAEQVVNTKKAAKATGRVGQTVGNINAVTDSGPQRKRSNPFRGNHGTKLPNTGSGRGTSSSAGQVNWFCYCCKSTTHSGGWKDCPKFKTDFPNWKPGDPNPVFQ